MSGQPRLAGGTSGHFGMTVAFSKIPWQSRGRGELLAFLQPLAAWPLPPDILSSLALGGHRAAGCRSKRNQTLGQQDGGSSLCFPLAPKQKREARGCWRSQPSGLFSCFSDNVLIACLASGSAGWLLLEPAGALLFFFLLEIKINIGKEPCAFPHPLQ